MILMFTMCMYVLKLKQYKKTIHQSLNSLQQTHSTNTY